MIRIPASFEAAPRGLCALILLAACGLQAADVKFVEHTIATGLKGGYQVVVADLNRDGKPDLLVVASGMSDLLWFENPNWERHVIAGGFKGLINAAVYDVDGDGIPEIALAHGFAMQVEKSAGIVSILEHKGDPRGLWSVREIDRLTTSHRLRFADIDGTGKKVLINAALTGAKALAPDYRDHVPLVYYRPGEWSRQLAGDQNEGVMHGIYPIDWDRNGREAILTASFVGIDLYRYGADHHWSREEITKGDPAPWPKCGTSDVAVGRGPGGRFLATIEPWHGNEVVVYRKSGSVWERKVIDDTLDDTHSIVTADLDGDGRDELVVAQRGKPFRVLVYRETKAGWQRRVVDDGRVSAAACATGDLNGDRRPDVVCVGSTTANLKWYENVAK
jgi:hypothetical protein